MSLFLFLSSRTRERRVGGARRREESAEPLHLAGGEREKGWRRVVCQRMENGAKEVAPRRRRTHCPTPPPSWGAEGERPTSAEGMIGVGGAPGRGRQPWSGARWG
jgi:hypothetical protein